MEKCLKQIVDLQTEKNERKKQRNFVHLMKKCSEYALNGIDYKHCKTMKKTSKSFLSDAIRAVDEETDGSSEEEGDDDAFSIDLEDDDDDEEEEEEEDVKSKHVSKSKKKSKPSTSMRKSKTKSKSGANKIAKKPKAKKTIKEKGTKKTQAFDSEDEHFMDVVDDDQKEFQSILSAGLSNYGKKERNDSKQFLTKATNEGAAKMRKYYKKLEKASVTPFLEKMKEKVAEANEANEKLKKGYQRTDEITKELALHVEQTKEFKRDAEEKQRELVEATVNATKQIVSLKRKFSQFCNSVQKKQEEEYTKYIASKQKKKQKFMQQMMQMIESNF